MVARLCVNVDHIATVRQARGGDEPDPVAAAALAELAGADGIVVHLRGDRRHIQDRDLQVLRRTVKTHLNVEMAATEEMVSIAERLRVDQVTLVPERPREVTTEGGLDADSLRAELEKTVRSLRDAGIEVSLFIDPDPLQVAAASDLGADIVELNTDAYSTSRAPGALESTHSALCTAARKAGALNLRVAAGHGLNYRNVRRIAAIPEVEELNIGHNIIARATLVGIERAVREMLELIRLADRST